MGECLERKRCRTNTYEPIGLTWIVYVTQIRIIGGSSDFSQSFQSAAQLESPGSAVYFSTRSLPTGKYGIDCVRALEED